MKLVDVKLVGETDSSGDKTLTSTRSFFGFLEKLIWVQGDLAGAGDGVLSVINTSSGTDETIFTFTDINGTASFYPRTLVHGLTKTALTGTAGGDRARVLIAGELKLVISNGGDTLTGGCIAYISEDN